MDNQPETPRIYANLLGASTDLGVEGIAKTRRNQTQNYNFRGIDEVLNAMSPALVKNKIVVVPRMTQRDCVERQTKGGGALFYVTVKAEFDFVSAEDGSSVTVSTFGEAMDTGDKATNKAMSAAYKYAAFLTLCIPLEGMGEDADAQTHEVEPLPKKQERQALPPPARPTPPPTRAAARPTMADAPKINPAAVARLKALMKTHGTDVAHLGREMTTLWGYKKWSDIAQVQYDLICRCVIEGLPLSDVIDPPPT